MPLAAVVQPALQVHWPFDPHWPFRQLQVAGAPVTTGTKHRPEPEIPSSQEVHPEGHGWQVGPKKPFAQDSQDDPVNPVGQVHTPEAEQTPEPAHGGEHAEDCISRRLRPLAAPEGS